MTDMPIRPCGATRPALRDPGWECTGSGLVVVMQARYTGVDLPVVLPARALEIVEPADWWDTPVARFEGGDHLHLCVMRRPPPERWRPDGVMLIGDQAIPVMNIRRWVLS
jgi:hypothetical protein